MANQNNNLYINAPMLLSLIECLQLKTESKEAYNMAEEIQNIILDVPWKEIN